MIVNDKVKYWLELSDDDLITAKCLLENKRLLHCGYFCHQVVEKALKAVITNNTDEMPPKIHDLPKLANKGLIYDLLSENQLLMLDKLKPLQIEARYPEYKELIAEKLNGDYCKELVLETENLLCWIKELLEK